MSKQLQWAIGGLALLLALLIVGFVALQIYLSVNMKRFKEELAGPEPKTETEQPSEQVQVPEVNNRPPSPDDGREYVWHGDHLHEVPIAPPDVGNRPHKGHQSEPESPKALSKKEIAARYTKEESDYWQSQGLNPPSPGYFYRHDENGVPKLYAENQPHFRLTGWTEGYGNTTLLSDEEWERYKALIPIANQTRLVLKEGMGTRDTTMFPDDVAALAREWMNELWEKTKSPRPLFSSFAQYTRLQTLEDQERETQLLQEQYDIHVPPDTRSSDANHILIKSILNELKAELRSR